MDSDRSSGGGRVVDNIVEDVERMEKTERGESRESGGRDERSNKKGEREEWI